MLYDTALKLWFRNVVFKQAVSRFAYHRSKATLLQILHCLLKMYWAFLEAEEDVAASKRLHFGWNLTAQCSGTTFVKAELYFGTRCRFGRPDAS